MEVLQHRNGAGGEADTRTPVRLTWTKVEAMSQFWHLVSPLLLEAGISIVAATLAQPERRPCRGPATP